MTIGGFSDGIPKKAETWPFVANGRVYTFGKVRKSAMHFVYYCQRSVEYMTGHEDLSTGFETDRDLTQKEVEQWPQFVTFIAVDDK